MSNEQAKPVSAKRNAAVQKRRAALLEAMRREVAAFKKIVRGKSSRTSGR